MADKISAIILAGGQGRRFNHRDKGLIEWKEKPLIAHVIQHISPQVEQIVISCNRNYDQYRALGYHLCEDKLDDYQGPLAGIQAALPSIEQAYCLVCPCDTPRLPDDLVARLYTAMTKANADISYPACNGRRHYLPALLRTSLAQDLDRYLAAADRSMKGWFKGLNALEVDFSDRDTYFANINTPQALADA